MSLMDFFKKSRKEYGDYTQSSHIDVYEAIAHKLSTTPQHVYEIAHGKHRVCYDDSVIWSELLKAGIVHPGVY